MHGSPCHTTKAHCKKPPGTLLHEMFCLQVDVQLPCVRCAVLGFHGELGQVNEVLGQWEDLSLACSRSPPAAASSDGASSGGHDESNTSRERALYWVQAKAGSLKVGA